MEESEKRVLGQYRHRLANEIVVTESFLCAFCESNVLDKEMSAVVQNELSYVSKAHRLLELLPKRGYKAFTTLLEILSITNPWLAEKMKTSYIEEKNREAKLKITSSITASGAIFGVPSQKEPITGYGSTSRKQLDDDIKKKVTIFIKRNLFHLTETEQKETEKWLAEEIQRERTRQQNKRLMSDDAVRIPTPVFQSSKEVQTDTNAMDIQELYEDMAIHMYGTDFDFEVDVSFRVIKEQVKEILDRMNCLDRVMMQCLEKFEDVDRMSMTLPQLVERSTISERDLNYKLSEEKRRNQRLQLEKDYLVKHIAQLESDVDRLYDKHNAMFVRPQKAFVKKKHEVSQKKTRPKSDRIPDHYVTIIDDSDKDEDSSRDISPVAPRRPRHTRSSPPKSAARSRRVHSNQSSSMKVKSANFDTIKFEPSTPSTKRKPIPSRNYQILSQCYS
ncbi:uncharacterized protein LOC124131577 isoform X1 [Haliotis rufescens]|uniref:uncharacterized protein LOC124131577 isoform X1 n=1 Tax=Haliotis rufescens TaxID=6454 RepID=UPI00201EBB52|nr:uncharacterized protein LOC124131577 isoform X1 [Haliotis rufescens]